MNDLDLGESLWLGFEAGQDIVESGAEDCSKVSKWVEKVFR